MEARVTTDGNTPTEVAGLRAPHRLRCELRVDPVGIDVLEPRLSWEVQDGRRGARQMAYQVLVASSRSLLAANEGDRWDSGRVESARNAHIEYAGSQLRSRDRAWWKVRTWDASGDVSAWSQAASFEIGLVLPSGFPPNRDWDALLIRAGGRGDLKVGAPAPYFRREFTVDGHVERARLYVTAFGLYEASINGQRVTDDVYRPGWTDYRVRLPYQVYDVTEWVRSGANVVGAVVGDGWYCGRNAITGGTRQVYGDRPGLIAQLEVFVAGSDTPIVVPTGADWRTSTGPILRCDNYDGEEYDARLELTGWDAPGYDDASWQDVEASGYLPELVAAVAPPVRRTQELLPVESWTLPDGRHVFDLGQNMVGWVRLRVEQPVGTEITLRFAEMLDPDRSLHTKNLGSARATDAYVCRGGGIEEWEPRFTFHGFRYVEVAGLVGSPAPDVITGVVIHSDMPRSGTFSCSNPLVNRLFENIVWSQRGNSIDVPTDCPQRGERLGWTGDIAMFARAAVFNFDASAFLAKWVTDLLDGQLVGGVEDGQFPLVAPRGTGVGGGPAWSDAAVLVPWSLYLAYGDTRVLDSAYPALVRWMRCLDRQAAGRTPGAWAGFGDWVSLDFDPDHPLGWDDRWGGTPLELLRRAFHAHAADLLARFATVLDLPHDRERWLEHAAGLRAAFAAAHIRDGHLLPPTQTACAIALMFDLLDDPAVRAAAATDLVADVERRGHLVTGFVGTPFLLHALERAGRVDLAYALLERTDRPGWLYPVTQGATTIWERWDAWTPDVGFHPSGMNSFNHYAYGAVGHWLHRTVGGLDVDERGPGYARIRVAPRPGGSITSAAVELHTVVGEAACRWSIEGGGMDIQVTIPANSVATMHFPAGDPKRIAEAGTPLDRVDGVTGVEVVPDGVTCELGAGRYDFHVAEVLHA